jgi:MoxR-like ATPase
MSHQDTDNILDSLNHIILGKSHPIKLALTCLLAKGHLLIEDVPGVGKTTLAHALAISLGLSYQRIQFTSDMLPADVLGVSVLGRDSGQFEFHPGPIFNQLILADEVNRASPRTQSALLEAMEEQQVTIEGQTYSLPTPFFVIATQNPSNQIGTFPLPESQLDRFLMRIAIGYPDAASEKQLLQGDDRRDLLQQLRAVITDETLADLQIKVSKIHTSDALIDYVQRLLAYSRESGAFINGLSPRAGLSLIHAAKAWAFISGQTHVLPEDVQAVLPSVVNHRLQLTAEQTANSAADLLTEAVALI